MHKRIEHLDDERDIDNGIIVMLKYGWSFEPGYHEGVRGFDTHAEVNAAVKGAYKCGCDMCKSK